MNRLKRFALNVVVMVGMTLAMSSLGLAQQETLPDQFLTVLGALSPTQRAARALGTPSNLGNGTVASYAEFDKSGAPKAIGVVFRPAP